MEYRNIVVHVNSSPASERRLDLAMRVAERAGSRLEALFAVADSTLRVVSSRHRLALAAPAAADLEQSFYEAAATKGIVATWQTLVADSVAGVSHDVILRARFADLAVLGQFEPATNDGSVPAELVDQVILRSGTPVLVVPYAGSFPVVGEHILIAWNTSREATRAVRDALPLLAGARQVTVLALAPTGDNNRFGDPDVEHLLGYLGRHGVRAQAERLVFDPTAINAADRLLSHLADAGADVLVIGGPGVALGKAQAKRSLTLRVLASLTVPMLVSY